MFVNIPNAKLPNVHLSKPGLGLAGFSDLVKDEEGDAGTPRHHRGRRWRQGDRVLHNHLKYLMPRTFSDEPGFARLALPPAAYQSWCRDSACQASGLVPRRRCL